MHEYNTSRPDIILKEYGRNVQKIVEHIKTIDDAETRNRYAATLIELMKQLTPGPKDSADPYNKFWDDLHIMAGFKLEVESPYPVPPEDIIYRKPRKVEYSTHKLRYKHYGHNVELMIAKAIELEDPEEKAAAVSNIARLMKTFYVTWNKEVVDDVVIIEHLRQMSGGKLSLDADTAKEQRLFENQPRGSRRVAPTYSDGAASSNNNYRNNNTRNAGGSSSGRRDDSRSNDRNGNGSRPNNSNNQNRGRRK